MLSTLDSLSERLVLRLAPRATALRRTFWLLMMGLHAPAIIGVFQALLSGGDVTVSPARLLGIASSFAFFTLKLADVRWLRFRSGWRSWIAVVLVLALIHAEGLGIAAHGTIVPQIMAVLSGSLLLEPTQRRLDKLFHQSLRPRAGRPGRAGAADVFVGRVADVVYRLPQWLDAHVAAPPRAPPA